VGEFHYVHHQPDGTFYKPSYLVAERIARAAQKVGIRLTLLHTAYHSNGPQTPATTAQKQFIFPDQAAFMKHVEAARKNINFSHVEHGVALHSIRACPREWMRPIADYARSQQLPLHVHAAEQTDELSMCQQAYGMSPIELLYTEGVLGHRTTVVHGTHVSKVDMELLAKTNTIVCICPSTERNLGDGMAPIEAYLQHKIRIVIGTDSHARIDVADEMRSLEDHERLRLRKRLVWLERADDLMAALTPVVCADGYAALGKRDIEPSDRVYIDIPAFLESCSPLHVAQDWLIGGSAKDIRHVFVGPEQVIKDGYSTRIDEAHLHQQVNGILKRLTE
jgi:formiminoglutamate deiminase